MGKFPTNEDRRAAQRVRLDEVAVLRAANEQLKAQLRTIAQREQTATNLLTAIAKKYSTLEAPIRISAKPEDVPEKGLGYFRGLDEKAQEWVIVWLSKAELEARVAAEVAKAKAAADAAADAATDRLREGLVETARQGAGAIILPGPGNGANGAHGAHPT